MPRYGTIPYGSTTYGYALTAVDLSPGTPAPPAASLSPAQLAAWYTLSRPPWYDAADPPAAPLLPPHNVPARSMCAEVHAFNLATWTVGALLPSVAPGAVREAALQDDRYSFETLSFAVQDKAAYLPGGASAGLIAPGQAVCVVWTVAVPGYSTTYRSPPYVIVSPFDRGDDRDGGGPFPVRAIDLLQYSLALTYTPHGYVDFLAEYARTLAAVADGMPVPDYTASAATLVLTHLWEITDGHVTAAWPVPSNSLAGLQVPGFGVDEAWVLVGDPGREVTRGEYLDFLWRRAPFRCTYAADGTPRLRTVRVAYAGGWAVGGCDPAAVGTLDLPWTDLQRAFSDPASRRRTYALVTTPGEAVAIDSGDAAYFDQFTGEAVSWASLHPYRAGTDRSAALVERDVVVEPAGFGELLPSGWRTDPNAYCRYLLGRDLGAADVVTVTTSKAMPPPELGSLLPVRDPRRAIAGTYRLTGFTQPLSGATPATWVLHWVEDG